MDSLSIAEKNKILHTVCMCEGDPKPWDANMATDRVTDGKFFSAATKRPGEGFGPWAPGCWPSWAL